jgi:hypothetical protein
MKISGNREETHPLLGFAQQTQWLWRRKFTLLLLLTAFLGFASGVVLQRDDVIGASKRFVLSFFDETHAVSNYLASIGVEPERLTIDIKYKHYTKLVEWRRLALERDQITSDLKVYVPAEIRYGDHTIRVKLRLKGEWTDHVETDKWSFRVKISDDQNLFGMRRFSLQHPKTRSFGSELVYLNALEQHDIATVRYRFVAVTVNGQDLGVYALEEAIAKEMIEHRKRREGVVVRYSTELHYAPYDNVEGMVHAPKIESGIGGFATAPVTHYGGNKVEVDEGLNGQLQQARNLLERFRDGELPVNAVFDIPRWAHFFAVSELMGTEVMVRDWKDRRFLYNPLTTLLEPVGIEGANFIPLVTISGAANDRPRDEFHSLLFEDEEFLEYYIAALEEVSSPDYVSSLFNRIDTDLKDDFQIVHSEWPRWSFSREVVSGNAALIRAHLSPKQGLHAYLASRGDGLLQLELGAIQSMPLEILAVDYSGVVVRPRGRLVLPGKAPADPMVYQTVDFPLPASDTQSQAELSIPVLRYRILGSQKVYSQEITAPRTLDTSVMQGILLKRPANHGNFPFLDIDEELKVIAIKPGHWRVEEDLVLPRGYEIRAPRGVQLTLANGATIYSRSPLRFTGSSDAPIVIDSLLAKGGGLLVHGAAGTSLLEHVQFHGMAAPSTFGFALTGAVTFYESAVEIRNCLFSQNRSEDGLNIIRSQYLIEESVFSGTPSDALDSDFATGRVVASHFMDIGADGLDFSGSEVTLEDLQLRDIGDKGLSIGEASSISASSLRIESANIGLAVKDKSNARFDDVEMKDVNIGLALFQKKPEYGPARSIVSALRLVNVETDFIVESGSELVVDGSDIGVDDKAAKAMLAAMY